MTPNDIILPQNVRKAIYLTFVVLGLGSGAAHVGFSSAGQTDPLWLTVASAVLAFLVSAPLIVALINITPQGAAADAERAVDPNGL